MSRGPVDKLHKSVTQLRSEVDTLRKELGAKELGAERVDSRVQLSLVREQEFLKATLESLRGGMQFTSRRSGKVGNVDRIEIDRLQIKSGKSQREVAEASDFALSTYRNCLNGEVPHSTLDALAVGLTNSLQERLHADDLDGPEGRISADDLLPVILNAEVVRRLKTELGIDTNELLSRVNATIPDELKKAGVVVSDDDHTYALGEEVLHDLEGNRKPVAVLHHQVRALARILDPTKTNPRFLYLKRNESKGVRPEVASSYIEQIAIPKLIDAILESRDLSSGGFLTMPSREHGRTQAFTSAQCLTALATHDGHVHRDIIREGLTFLNATTIRGDSNSAIEGWSYFFGQTDPVTEIACWVAIAYARSLRRQLWSSRERDDLAARLKSVLEGILRHQAPKGGFSPTKHAVDSHIRTYASVMAIWAMIEAICTDRSLTQTLEIPLTTAATWLVQSHTKSGFLADPENYREGPYAPGLHAHAVFVLSLLERLPHFGQHVSDTTLRPLSASGYKKAKDLLLQSKLPACWSVGNESLPDHALHFEEPVIDFRSEAGRNLWGPWTLAALHNLSQLDVAEATTLRDQVVGKFYEFHRSETASSFHGILGIYEVAEAAFSLSYIREEKFCERY